MVDDEQAKEQTLFQNGLHLSPGLADGPVGQDVAGSIWAGREGRVVTLRVQVYRPVDEIH